MIVHFTPQEREWIERVPFDVRTWDLSKPFPDTIKVKDGCPDDLRESIEGKKRAMRKPQSPLDDSD